MTKKLWADKDGFAVAVEKDDEGQYMLVIHDAEDRTWYGAYLPLTEREMKHLLADIAEAAGFEAMVRIGAYKVEPDNE